MPTRDAARLLRAISLVAIAAAAGQPWCGAHAGDGPAAPVSPYRLVVPSPASYRLAPPPRVISAALADQPFASEIDAAARDADLDPALLHAVIHVESHYQPRALSPKGAVGLMQVMPDTGARFGVPHPDRSVQANLKAGSLYLRNLMQQFDGRLDLVLAAYNAGEGAVVRHAMAIPPYAETRRYVPAVMAKYEEWRTAVNAPTRIDYLPGTRLMMSIR